MFNFHERRKWSKYLSLLMGLCLLRRAHSLVSPRRRFLNKLALIASATTSPPVIVSANEGNANDRNSLSNRLEDSFLNIPLPSPPSELSNKGVDNFFFPAWMEGEWAVTQTLVSTQTPLGIKYVGGPSGSEQIARKSLKEQEVQLNRAVELRLRFVKTKWGVAEDRLFNIEQRLNQFAGGNKKVVSTVEYANVNASNRMSVVGKGGTEFDPLTTTLTYFRGPAAQKTFMTSHGSEFAAENNSIWYGYELDRSIFALTNTNTAPPVTTDQEIIWELQRLSDKEIKGRLRLAGYLNAQSDELYFDAKNRAVSLADYTLQMKKIS